MGRRWSSGLTGIVVAVALLASACGASDSVATNDTTEPVSNELAFGLQRCDPDAPWQSADPSVYRDTPVYAGNEQPTEAVRAWATGQPGFEGTWVDRDHNGWISVGFSEDAPARQQDLESEFPDVGVVAVAVTATEDELVALRGRVEAALQGLSSWGIGHSVPTGLVDVSVPVLDVETLERLRDLAGPTLCVSGADPAEAVTDGPQPTEGDGWRLLGTDRTGDVYRTGVATTAEQYEQLWSLAALDGDRPRVDFGAEIVIWFGAVYGGNCPIRLDDVVIDNDAQLVHGDFVMPGNPTFCHDDANAEAYIVAVQRDELPAAPFDVQLDADDPPSGAPQERTRVEVDLRPVGATADADELQTPDVGAPQLPDQFTPGYVIEDGFPWTLLIDLDCSVDVISDLNGISWRSTDRSMVDGPPPRWTAGAIEGRAEAEFLLTTDPAHLTITVNGLTVDYDPVPADEEADMSCE